MHRVLVLIADWEKEPRQRERDLQGVVEAVKRIMAERLKGARQCDNGADDPDRTYDHCDADATEPRSPRHACRSLRRVPLAVGREPPTGLIGLTIDRPTHDPT